MTAAAGSIVDDASLPPVPLDGFVSLERVAQAVGVTTERMRDLAKAGWIEPTYLGRYMKFSVARVRDFVARVEREGLPELSKQEVSEIRRQWRQSGKGRRSGFARTVDRPTPECDAPRRGRPRIHGTAVSLTP